MSVEVTDLPQNWLEDEKYQERSLAFIDGHMVNCRFHVQNMCFGANNKIDLNNPSFLPASDPNYQPPSKALLKSVVELMMSRGYTKVSIGEMLGVSTVQSRTLNNWLSEGKGAKIPYCAWRMLTNLAGITITTMAKPIKIESV